jgi:hypothetical protein
VVRAEDALVDFQRALQEGPGGGQLALILEQEGEVVEAVGGVGVVGAEDAFAGLEGALQEGPGGGQLALGVE